MNPLAGVRAPLVQFGRAEREGGCLCLTGLEREILETLWTLRWAGFATKFTHL
jgi:hypothetical protein